MNKYFFIFAFLFLYIAPDLYANSALFSSVNSKATELQNGLNTLGIVIITIVVMIASIGAIMGTFSKFTALKIIAGGIVFGAAPALANWLLS
ncbi:TrbC/VirB2 family protein [Aliarcobacter skirrowii]|nr:TrbC/VirB2 family protein [Aliarcobacter skirrowii]AXX85114.1 putative membrane protein [Aliarcobacter skirrowii CCUG 10374]SUU96360.1 TrbC/VIRB2 family [Aliarcobacter skirrowii]